ncbi:trypsin delta [Drosophila teissieri]|uniref:trypsin delta n=1 Tax=Drosophila teissieri TaxID=7243 RepID=UPI001CBA04A9|nr:trypsin delta [Drosophila teissieri]
MLSQCFHLLLAIHLLILPVVPELLEPSERIIGGISMDITNVPWQVSLQKYGQHTCGGSIYSETIVITAAHCIGDTSHAIRAGSSLHDSGGVLVSVKSIIIHPQYDRSNHRNDVAVLKLSRPLSFSDSIQTIPLAEKDPPTGSMALSTGWGLNSIYVKPQQLRGVEISIRWKSVCKWKYPFMFNEDICAGRIGKGVCNGDSGGPLVVDGQLVGISSRKGNLLCYGSSLFASVSYYRNWILKAIESI